MNRYLLLDSRNIDTVEHAALRPGQLAKHPRNPLFTEEAWSDPPKRWEARYDNVYPNVLYDADDRRFKIWYHSFIRDESAETTPPDERTTRPWTTAGRQAGLLYAWSEDGLSWHKPPLGLVAFQGSSANNIVLTDLEGGVFKDARDPDGRRRFKFFGRAKNRTRMVGAFSADGLHWSEPAPWPEYGARADTHNNAIWAPNLSRYVGITRGRDGPVRTVLRSESEDFIHWSDPQEIMRGDNPYDELYSMPIFSYGTVYLGFPAILHGCPRFGTDRSALHWNKVTTELAWSPDARTWHRLCSGQPLIPLGGGDYPDGDSDCGCIYASTPVLHDNRIDVYYGASNGLHNDWREGALNLASLRPDGFAGYAADSHETGIIRTQPFQIVDRGSLRVNADIDRGGSLRVSLLDPDGREMPGYGQADAVLLDDRPAADARIAWRKQPFEALAGQTVRFQFEFRQATLYAFDAPCKL